MLIVFSGLPGTGKTTISRRLASRMDATYLRVDAIEQAIRDARVLADDVGRSGYLVAIALARSNLDLGRVVIVDCVNPVTESRVLWREMAARIGVPLVNIEVVCSDALEYRRRVETRTVDVPGLAPPNWQSVLEHDYEAWADGPLQLDSAVLSPDEAVEAAIEQLALIRDYAVDTFLSLAVEQESDNTVELTHRELEILKWSAFGKTAWETARILSCSEANINYHLSKIRKKFNVGSRRMAIVKALQMGLLEF